MKKLEDKWGCRKNPLKDCKKRSEEEVQAIFSEYWQQMGITASLVSDIYSALQKLVNNDETKEMKEVSGLKEKMEKVRIRNAAFKTWLQFEFDTELKKLLEPGTHKLGYGMSPEVFQEPFDIKYHLLLPLDSGFSALARQIDMLEEQPNALEIMEQEDKKSRANK